MKHTRKYGSTSDQLPLQRQAHQAGEVRKIKPEFSVFIVDDDPVFLYALSFHLKKDLNWKIFCYATPEECLANLDLNPNVIVLDYFFASAGTDHVDGMLMLKTLRKINPTLPVIMISSQTNMNTSLDLLKAGAYTYLLKDKDVLRTVEQVLRSLFVK